MAVLSNYLQTGDWKSEKHVPIIHAPESFRANELTEVKISIGDEIAHPNTLEHHIVWFKLFYLGNGSKFPVELGSYYFSAHGEDNAFTEPVAHAHIKLAASGKLIALGYCNIHGLWENSVDITVAG